MARLKYPGSKHKTSPVCQTKPEASNVNKENTKEKTEDSSRDNCKLVTAKEFEELFGDSDEENEDVFVGFSSKELQAYEPPSSTNQIYDKQRNMSTEDFIRHFFTSSSSSSDSGANVNTTGEEKSRYGKVEICDNIYSKVYKKRHSYTRRLRPTGNNNVNDPTKLNTTSNNKAIEKPILTNKKHWRSNIISKPVSIAKQLLEKAKEDKRLQLVRKVTLENEKVSRFGRTVKKKKVLDYDDFTLVGSKRHSENNTDLQPAAKILKCDDNQQATISSEKDEETSDKKLKKIRLKIPANTEEENYPKARFPRQVQLKKNLCQDEKDLSVEARIFDKRTIRSLLKDKLKTKNNILVHKNVASSRRKNKVDFKSERLKTKHENEESVETHDVDDATNEQVIDDYIDDDDDDDDDYDDEKLSAEKKVENKVIRRITKRKLKNGKIKKIIKYYKVKDDEEYETSTPVIPGRRRVRCGNCKGCSVLADCGKCIFCKDKSKFGGQNIMKQCCRHKKCLTPCLPEARKVKVVRKRVEKAIKNEVKHSKKRNTKEVEKRAIKPNPGPLIIKHSKMNTVSNEIKFSWTDAYTEDDCWETGFHICVTNEKCLPPDDLCFLCGSAGKEKMLYCRVCAEPFHHFCVDEDPIDSQWWVCNRCRTCCVCGHQNKLLMCDNCQRCYHVECLGPNYSSDPQGSDDSWLCGRCVKCTKCGRSTPGDASDDQWTQGFTMCATCGKNWSLGNYCPLCKKCYSDEDFDSKMIQCVTCNRWVHATCQGLTDDEYQCLSVMPDDIQYSCKLCSGEKDLDWLCSVQQEIQAGFIFILDKVIASTFFEILRKDFKQKITESSFCKDFDDLVTKVKNKGYDSVESYGKDVLTILKCAKTEISDIEICRNLVCLVDFFKKEMKSIFPWQDLIWPVEEPQTEISTNNKTHTPSENINSGDMMNIVIQDHSYVKKTENHKHDEVKENDVEMKETAQGSDERKCVYCNAIGDGRCRDAGRLLYFNIDEWAHVNCVLWSAEVYEDDEGRLQNAHVSLSRGRLMRCEFCSEVGATVGCCEPRCPANYHFMCGRKAKAAFLPDKTVYCNQHSFRAKKKVILQEKDFFVERRVSVDMSKIKTTKKGLRGTLPESLAVLSGCMKVKNIGKITIASDTSTNLIPINYKVSRLYWSTVDPKKRCVYTCYTEEVDISEQKFNKVGKKNAVDADVKHVHVVTCHEDDVSLFDNMLSTNTSLLPRLPNTTTQVTNITSSNTDDKTLMAKKPAMQNGDAFVSAMDVLVNLSKQQKVSVPNISQSLSPLTTSMFQSTPIFNHKQPNTMKVLKSMSSSCRIPVTSQTFIHRGPQPSLVLSQTLSPSQQIPEQFQTIEKPTSASMISSKSRTYPVLKPLKATRQTGQTGQTTATTITVSSPLFSSIVQKTTVSMVSTQSSASQSTKIATLSQANSTTYHQSSNTPGSLINPNPATSNYKSTWTQNKQSTVLSGLQFSSGIKTTPLPVKKMHRVVSKPAFSQQITADKQPSSIVKMIAVNKVLTTSCAPKLISNSISLPMISQQSHTTTSKMPIILKKPSIVASSNNQSTIISESPIVYKCIPQSSIFLKNSQNLSGITKKVVSSVTSALRPIAPATSNQNSSVSTVEPVCRSVAFPKSPSIGIPPRVLSSKKQQLQVSCTKPVKFAPKTLPPLKKKYIKVLPKPPTTTSPVTTAITSLSPAPVVKYGPNNDTQNLAVVVGSPEQIAKLLVDNPNMLQFVGNDTSYLGRQLSSQLSAVSVSEKKSKSTIEEQPIECSSSPRETSKPGTTTVHQTTQDCQSLATNVSGEPIVIDLTKNADEKLNTGNNLKLTTKANLDKARRIVRKLDKKCSESSEMEKNNGAVILNDEVTNKLLTHTALLSPKVPTNPTLSSQLPRNPTLSPNTPTNPTLSPKVPIHPTLSPNVTPRPTTSPKAPTYPTLPPLTRRDPKPNHQYIFHNRRFHHANNPVFEEKANKVSPLSSPGKIIQNLENQLMNIKEPLKKKNCELLTANDKKEDENAEVCTENKQIGNSVVSISKNKLTKNKPLVTLGTNKPHSNTPTTNITKPIRDSNCDNLNQSGVSKRIFPEHSAENIKPKKRTYTKKTVRVSKRKHSDCNIVPNTEQVSSKKTNKKLKLDAILPEFISGKQLDLSRNKRAEKEPSNIIYTITSEEGFEVKARTCEDAWKAVFDKVQSIRMDHSQCFTSFVGADGMDMLGLTREPIIYLIEQLPGTKRCNKYPFKYHNISAKDNSDDEDLKVNINKHGCARAEAFTGRTNRFDMFSFLASPHRRLSQIPPDNPDDPDVAQEITARRATANDLPMAMRYRCLKQSNTKRTVGVFKSPIHRRGLFCLRDIDVGEMVIEYTGVVIRSALTDKREKYYESKGIGCYMFRVDSFDVVDATTSGDAARFINHSCEPNCYSRVITVEGQKKIIIFAARALKRGEELTYDYKFPLEEDKIPCSCNSKKCRKYLN